MRETCELCKSEIFHAADCKACANDDCALGRAIDENAFDRIQKALALLKLVESGEVTLINTEELKASALPENMATIKRMRAGESVEVRRVGGEWPCVYIYENGWCIMGVPENDSGEVCDTYIEAAAAWNARGGE